jgi:hypothetical protein
MNLLPKIDAQWKQLEKVAGSIAATPGTEIHTAISRLIAAIDQVSTCFTRVNEGAQHRQELVEIHCSQRNQPTLAMHEEYHEINAQLIADLTSYFSMVKTFLNSLALFIKEMIPQSKLRGLRFKSFGSLVESAKRTVASNMPNKELRQIIASKGAEFENKYVQYRDKHIEHPGKLTDKSISSANGVPNIIHYDRKAKTDCEEGKQTDEVHTREECITITSPEGYNLTFFHIAPSKDLDETSSINNGQSIGTPYDSTGLHFKKYGYHYHVFSSPEIEESLIEQTAPGGAILTTSPDPYEAMLYLGELTELILEIVFYENDCFNA